MFKYVFIGDTKGQTIIDDDFPFQVVETSQVLFSLETLIITVSAGAVAALVVGFVTGFCCGRRCHKDDNTLVGHLGYPDTEYEYFEQRGGLARPTLLNAGPPNLPPGMPPPGGPLLPQETAKLDSRHEEVIYFIFTLFDNYSKSRILFFNFGIFHQFLSY